eukprot:tig00000605_g2486.t1
MGGLLFVLLVVSMAACRALFTRGGGASTLRALRGLLFEVAEPAAAAGPASSTATGVWAQTRRREFEAGRGLAPPLGLLSSLDACFLLP